MSKQPPRHRVEFYRRGEKWRWKIVANNGTVVARSERGYTRKSKAVESADSLANSILDEGLAGMEDQP